MDSKMRIVTAALFFIALTAAFLVIYTQSSNSRQILPNTPETFESQTYERYKVFQKNGLYGVKSFDDEVIIEAQWDYIYSPKNGKFIVGEEKHGKTYYGALDEHGCVMIPVVYKSIDVLNSELLCAESFENKFAVYDTELNAFSDEEFYGIKENSDGSYDFSQKSIVYTTVVSNSDIYVNKLLINCNINTVSKYIEIIPKENIDAKTAKDYIQITLKSCDFIEALFYGDSNDDFSFRLLDDSILLGDNPNAQKNFNSLNQISPEITSDETGIKYECSVDFSYGVPVDDILNTGEYIDNRYEVTAQLNLQKSFEGDFEITSCAFSNS